MAAKGFDFDLCFTSLQTRAIKTLHLALEAMGRLWLPVEKDWRLNERHYGGLTGLNKAETAAKHGDEQVHIWRRSFDMPPPPLEPGGPFDLAERPPLCRHRDPDTESLKDTIARVLPYWEERIAPALRDGQRVLISAHGNSLRALVKHLSHIPDDEITGLEIPTGQPIVYELDDGAERDRPLLSERALGSLIVSGESRSPSAVQRQCASPAGAPAFAGMTGPSEFLDALAVAGGAAQDFLDACRRA